MSLATSTAIRSLQRKLYRKAKAEPAYRFYLLYDKIYREDILRHACALSRANAGAPGTDGMTFALIEALGLQERGVAGLREELISKIYRPDPVPATLAGITQMQTLTGNEATGGCAFACHQASTNNADTAGNPCADGTAPTLNSSMNTASPASSGIYCKTSTHGAQIDNYALARKNSISLRLDELNSGISTLLQTASTTAQSTVFATPPNYRFSIYSMDSLWSIGLTQLMPLTANYISSWTTDLANFGVMEMYSNNNDCANSACSSSTSSPGGDVATNFDNSLGDLSQASYIPNPGNGSNLSGDKPQEVLFIVTDGVEDEESGGSRLQQAINDLGNAPGGNSSSTNWCTTIKNRGIQIAVLYTDYLPVPGQQLVRELDRPGPDGHRPGDASLRLAGPLL